MHTRTCIGVYFVHKHPKEVLFLLSVNIRACRSWYLIFLSLSPAPPFQDKAGYEMPCLSAKERESNAKLLETLADQEKKYLVAEAKRDADGCRG